MTRLTRDANGGAFGESGLRAFAGSAASAALNRGTLPINDASAIAPMPELHRLKKWRRVMSWAWRWYRFISGLLSQLLVKTASMLSRTLETTVHAATSATSEP